MSQQPRSKLSPFARFMFATGVENSYPTIDVDGKALRVDEMEKCGHYKNWQEDFHLVKELGIEYLRYGPPYYSSHKGPGRYDWSFADDTFAALHELKIAPIADLCHFGVPDWVGDFQNPDWPKLFAQYAHDLPPGFRGYGSTRPLTKSSSPANRKTLRRPSASSPPRKPASSPALHLSSTAAVWTYFRDCSPGLTYGQD